MVPLPKIESEKTLAQVYAHRMNSVTKRIKKWKSNKRYHWYRVNISEIVIEL